MYDSLKENYFVFGGMDSRKYHAYIFDRTTHNAGARGYNKTQIPGRLGDYITDLGRIDNVVHEYSIIVLDDCEKNLRGLRSELLSKSGYQRLEDTYHKDEYYSAYFDGAINPRVDKTHTMAKCTLSFNRKPQRYLKGNDDVIVRKLEDFDSVLKYQEFEVKNPSPFPAYPLITIVGNGVVSLTMGAYMLGRYISSFRIDRETTDSTTIDCGIMEAYDTNTKESVNSSITVFSQSGKRIYPYFPADINTTIRISPDTTTSITIEPRFYMM